MVGFFSGKLPKGLIVFIISMFPILELRGSILAAGFLKMEFLPTYITAVIGNMLPIPFILLFIDKIFVWLKKTKLKNFVEKIENKAMSKEDIIRKYKVWGLLIFVAIPLPGTGAWTGALIAAMFDIRLKTAFPVIALGVLIAGIIISIISFGALSVFFS